MAETRIEWADAVWNPITGCTKVSPGCKHCYAERFAQRLRGRFGYPTDEPFRVTLHPERLDEPLRWRKPRRVFVNSMSDLFHPDVPYEFIAAVWGVMQAAVDIHGHTFLVLTKRPERIALFFEWLRTVRLCPGLPELGEAPWERRNAARAAWSMVHLSVGNGILEYQHGPWPVPGIWLGVSAENQKYADQRIPVLLKTPAAVRFVSCEPLLGPIDLRWLIYDSITVIDSMSGKHGIPEPHAPGPKLDWVVVGGETGPGARPMHPDWVRTIRDQCIAAGVPFFFKQWGEYVGGQVMERLSNGKPGWCHYENNTATPMWTHDWGDGFVSWRVGKSEAGRLLDGRTWDELPRGEAA